MPAARGHYMLSLTTHRGPVYRVPTLCDPLWHTCEAVKQGICSRDAGEIMSLFTKDFER